MRISRTIFGLLTFSSALGAGACGLNTGSDSAGDSGGSSDSSDSSDSTEAAEDSSNTASDSGGSDSTDESSSGDSGTTTGSEGSDSGSSSSSTTSTEDTTTSGDGTTTEGGETTTTGDETTTEGDESTTGVASDADGTGAETMGGDTTAGMGNGSPGCGSSTSPPDPRDQQTIQVGDLQRYFLMYVPENRDPDEPLDLVFGIHGLNMNNVWAAHDDSGFQLIQATGDQAILIYPQGIQGNGQSVEPSSQSQWGDADSNWGGPPPNANPDRIAADLAYFDALIEYVTENYCVDLDRIFAVGFSQGGFMTNTLGCERADVFRGLAPVAGWGPLGSSPTCSDSTASHAVLQVQGDTDGTVTPQLGQATRDFWRMRAGCSGESTPSSWGDGCVEYQGCAAETPIVYCTHGGGHFVPEGSGQRAWDFFQSLE